MQAPWAAGCNAVLPPSISIGPPSSRSPPTRSAARRSASHPPLRCETRTSRVIGDVLSADGRARRLGPAHRRAAGPRDVGSPYSAAPTWVWKPQVVAERDPRLEVGDRPDAEKPWARPNSVSRAAAPDGAAPASCAAMASRPDLTRAVGGGGPQPTRAPRSRRGDHRPPRPRGRDPARLRVLQPVAATSAANTPAARAWQCPQLARNRAPCSGSAPRKRSATAGGVIRSSLPHTTSVGAAEVAQPVRGGRWRASRANRAPGRRTRGGERAPHASTQRRHRRGVVEDLLHVWRTGRRSARGGRAERRIALEQARGPR